MLASPLVSFELQLSKRVPEHDYLQQMKQLKNDVRSQAHHGQEMYLCELSPRSLVFSICLESATS